MIATPSENPISIGPYRGRTTASKRLWVPFLTYAVC